MTEPEPTAQINRPLPPSVCTLPHRHCVCTTEFPDEAEGVTEDDFGRELDAEELAEHLALLDGKSEYVPHRLQSVRERQRGIPATPGLMRGLRRRRQERVWRAGAGLRVGCPQKSRARRAPRRARASRPIAKKASSDGDGPAPGQHFIAVAAREDATCRAHIAEAA